MKNLYILFACCFVVSMQAQNGLIWSTTYGGFDYDQPYALCKTGDGGTLIGGYSNSNDSYVLGNHGFSDILLVKFNSDGQFQWQKCYGGQVNEAALDILPMSNGTFCMVGRNQSFDGDCTAMYGDTDVWVTCVDADGNLIWQKSYGGALGDFGTSIIATPDNGLVFAGSAFSSNAPLTDQNGQGDMWVVKTDSTGTIEWANCFGSSTYDSGTIIRATQDGNIVFVGGFNTGNGEITETSHGATDALVVKMALDGTVLWQKAFGGSQNDLIEEMIELPDGSLVLAGDSKSSNGDLTSTNSGLTDFWIIRISESGSLLWSKNYGSTSSDFVRGLAQLKDGNIVFVGETQGVVNALPLIGAIDIYIGLLDTNGNLLHENILGGATLDYPTDVIIDLDGQLLVTGYTWSADNTFSSNIGYTDAFLFKYQIQQETCNGIDDDNDGQIDEFVDWDGDGFNQCSGDCNEYNALINSSLPEACNFADDNCNGVIDEGLLMLPYYPDGDNDGFGFGGALAFCTDPGFGFSSLNTDCDDTNGQVNPNMTEIPGNGIDDDCNESTTDVGVVESDIQIAVFPNPVNNGILNIRLNDISRNDKLEIFDMFGRKVHSQTVYGSNVTIDMSRFANGNYVLKYGILVSPVLVQQAE